MNGSLILAWLFFGTGALCSTTFVTLFLLTTKPWRRRSGEPLSVKRVRRDVLIWSGSVALLYLSSTVALITLHTHPSVEPGRMALSGIVAALCAHRLYTHLMINGRDDA